MIPLPQLVQMLRASGNPRAYLEAQARNNPVIAKALQMTNGKSPEEVMQIAQNLAAAQGADLDAVKKQLGV